MIRGRSSARTRIAWSFAVGLGLTVAGCGAETTPPTSDAKPAEKPAAGAVSGKLDKNTKDPRADMGLRELRESRRKKAD